MVVARDGFLLLHPHAYNGFFFLLTSKYLILNWINIKRLPENPVYTEMTQFYLTIMSMIDVRSGWADVRLYIFFFLHGLVWVCEIELSHMSNKSTASTA